jgi:flap endonuclease-1
LEDALKALGLTREQLIDVAILVGTDFNEGVKGIGPKKGLAAVKDGKIGELELGFDLEAVREVFLKPNVTGDYKIESGTPDKDALVAILCEEHDFSPNRVEKAAADIESCRGDMSQQDLSKWV